MIISLIQILSNLRWFHHISSVFWKWEHFESNTLQVVWISPTDNSAAVQVLKFSNSTRKLGIHGHPEAPNLRSRPFLRPLGSWNHGSGWKAPVVTGKCCLHSWDPGWTLTAGSHPELQEIGSTAAWSDKIPKLLRKSQRKSWKTELREIVFE